MWLPIKLILYLISTRPTISIIRHWKKLIRLLLILINLRMIL